MESQNIDDRKEKARHWKEEWKAFYPDREKDYLPIKLKPARLEVVDEKKGIVGDPRTWQTASVSFKTTG